MRKRTARRAAAAMAAAVLAGALSVGLGASAQSVETYADDFDPAGYSGSDGSLTWSGSWAEIGESDGYGAGAARVKGGTVCSSGNCVELGTFVGNDGVGIRRSADLSGAATATLTFTYQRVAKAGGGAIVVSAAPSPSGPWHQIGRYPFLASDPVPLSASVDLSAYAGGTVAIRFTIDGNEVKSRMGVDNLTITLLGVTPATTTTTPPATTTTTPPTTTTTTPPTTTTTPPTSTTTPPTSTTTPPTTTTTTTPPTTTTTPPGAATTTTLPGATTTTLPGAATTTTEPSATATTSAAAAATTTTAPGEIAASESSESSYGPEVLPSAGRLGERPTEGIAMAVAVMPDAEPTAADRRPLSRVTAVVATTVANIATPHVAYAALAVVVAWASVAGLERGERRKRGVRHRRR